MTWERNVNLEIARGEVKGYRTIHKFGRNPDIDSGAEAVWEGGGAYTGFNATAAEVVEVFSASGADALGSTGAEKIRLWGLDGDYNEVTEDVDMDGVTPASTANSYIRLDRARVIQAGSGGVNAGIITIRQSVTTANVFSTMLAGYNSTMIAAYTVPAGYQAFVDVWGGGLSGKVNATSTLRMWVKPFGQEFQVQEEMSAVGGGDSFPMRHYQKPKGPYPAKSDIYVDADSDSANTIVAALFDLTLVKG